MLGSRSAKRNSTPRNPSNQVVMVANATLKKVHLRVTLKAAGLSPENVRAGDLAALLERLEEAIVETAKARSIPLAFYADESLVSLIQVDGAEGIELTLALPEPILYIASEIVQAIVDRRFDRLPHEAWKCLHELSLKANNKRWAVEFQASEGGIGHVEIPAAVISYEFPVPKPLAGKLVEGTTTVWGNLLEIGGMPPRAVLRLRSGAVLSAPVSLEIVAEVQKRGLLYQDVGLSGVAEWRASDWALASFSASGIADYHPDQQGLGETFRALGNAAGGRWDNVDPIEYVDDLRS